MKISVMNETFTRRTLGRMDERTYRVTGMTCEHCVAAVTSEVGKVDGVTGVAVELASGRLAVSGDAYTDDEIRAAVAEAGYELADA